ncbi:MAG: ABC transporter ATP-binding protein [Gammaproteobacteria bacterium]|nr:ABC transporter ATP-binding protein [Gammaproteobacteria bacterium]MBQ0838669.1 ABC transporter ATP-binding protein [Gammaproteobacteria bacterium]
MPIIEVKHLTKEYDLGTVTSIKDTLRHTLAKIQGKGTWQRERFKALDDVNFTIEEGEVVGIIGHNGAGKSTLLKHLANITKPTSGEVIVNGSIAPLIEVGAGVNPELTGRENIFLNGAILGIPKNIIQSKLDEIIDFSELEQFIDTPVKRYSSGMTVKLGFSIATSMEADILIVDEVLAVGDIAFQRKCLTRMENMINKQGRTVLIVGHNVRQLERICSRMILLKHGQVIFDGAPAEATKLFLDETTLAQLDGVRKTNNVIKPSIDTNEIEVRAIEVTTNKHIDGTPVCPLFSDFHLQVTLYVPKLIKNVEINIGLHNPEMVFMTKSSTSLLDSPIDLIAGTHTIEMIIDKLSLCPGSYGIGIGIYDRIRRPLWTGNQLIWLLIEASSEFATKLPQGTLAYMPAQWSISDGRNTIIENKNPHQPLKNMEL